MSPLHIYNQIYFLVFKLKEILTLHSLTFDDLRRKDSLEIKITEPFFGS